MTSKAQKRAAKLAAKSANVTAPSTQATDSASPTAKDDAALTITTTTTQAPAATPKVVTKVVGVLKVKDGLSYRGARQAWYEVLKAHDGKPAQEYLEATTKTPPSLPKSGKQEPSSGWLRWFVRHEVATIQQTKAEKVEAEA